MAKGTNFRFRFPKVGIRKHNIIKLTKIFHGMINHLISHRNDLKMFKMQVELGTTGELFYFRVLNILTQMEIWLGL